jgi:hypothetical protein
MEINYDQILIGQSTDGAIITADIKEGVITCINDYCLIHKSETSDNQNYLVNWGCGGNATVNGKLYGRGSIIAEDHEPTFIDDGVKQIILDDEYYTTNGSFCEECNTFHDTEEAYNPTFVIFDDCTFLCKTCATAEDMMIPVFDADDIFNAKDIRNLDLDGFKEVHTIFHDCGWGGHATNQDQAKIIIQDLQEEHGELYAGLTGIGQFQVYVTLYKKTA